MLCLHSSKASPIRLEWRNVSLLKGRKRKFPVGLLGFTLPESRHRHFRNVSAFVCNVVFEPSSIAAQNFFFFFIVLNLFAIPSSFLIVHFFCIWTLMDRLLIHLTDWQSLVFKRCTAAVVLPLRVWWPINYGKWPDRQLRDRLETTPCGAVLALFCLPGLLWRLAEVVVVDRCLEAVIMLRAELVFVMMRH